MQSSPEPVFLEQSRVFTGLPHLALRLGRDKLAIHCVSTVFTALRRQLTSMAKGQPVKGWEPERKPGARGKRSSPRAELQLMFSAEVPVGRSCKPGSAS